MQGAIYCGVPAANTAFKITGEILRAEGPRAGAAAARRRRARRDAPHLQRAAAARRGAGARAPPVVLSHALGLDLHMWDALAARAGDDAHRCCATTIAATAARRGRPGRTRSTTSSTTRRALIREWGRGPVAFVGLSMGGMVGQGLAVRHPGAAARRSCSPTPTARYPEAARPTWAARIAAVEQGGMAAVADAVVERYLHADFRAAHPQVAARRCGRGCCARDPAGYVAALPCGRRRRLARPPGRRCALPTLVIAGARDVGATPEMAQGDRRAHPRRRAARLRRCLAPERGRGRRRIPRRGIVVPRLAAVALTAGAGRRARRSHRTPP